MAQSHDKYMLWEEISIDIDWGIIKGKVCGVGARKILGIHGWLDNANTFDLIAPYIKNDATFLTIDLPGHGLSSHFPPGFFYDIKSLVASIKKVTSKLQWRNFTFLTHSIGAIVGIVYSAVFPEDVNTFISIDIIKPKSYQPKDWAPNLRNYFNNYFKNEMLSLETPLEYSEEELISKTIEGSNCSLDVESAKILLIRSSRPSGCGTKRILTRDLRAKVNFVGFFPFDVWKEYASAIKCCILIIKAMDGPSFDTPEGNQLILDAFKENSPMFKYVEVKGKHHLHMTEAPIVGPILKDFLNSTKPLIEKVGCLQDLPLARY